MESKEQYLIDELKRELYEEVKLLNGCLIKDIEFIGFINDDTIPVGRVHIGLLYNINVSNKEVYINETDKMTADWVDKSNLAEFYKGMETWTKIVFDFYIQDTMIMKELNMNKRLCSKQLFNLMTREIHLSGEVNRICRNLCVPSP